MNLTSKISVLKGNSYSGLRFELTFLSERNYDLLLVSETLALLAFHQEGSYIYSRNYVTYIFAHSLFRKLLIFITFS